MAIETQRVYWSGKSIFPDTDDPGVDPDEAPLEGRIHFTPVWDEQASGLLSDSTDSVHLRTFTYALRGGRLMSKDDDVWAEGISLPARIGGVTLPWVAKFDLTSGAVPIRVRSISFNSVPGGTISLVDIVPQDAVYPRFSPDVVKGDSVESIHEQSGYLIFTVGKGSAARQIPVKIPALNQEQP